MEQETEYQNLEELQGHLNQINKIFGIDDILNQDITRDFIKDYYDDSSFGYTFFHSTEGSVHMALNLDGKFDEEGYYEQVKIIDKFIKDEGNVKNVLELGSGKGFNTIYLSKKNENLNFNALDLTPEFVEKAVKESKNIPNANFKIGDFHEIQHPDESFELAFEIEAVCHASDVRKVLSEVHRVLKPGGHFVAFDGYRQPNFDSLDSRLIQASKLVEISMAVEEGRKINEWLQIAEEVGFEIEYKKDISQAIMPNLLKFKKLARKYFKRKWRAKLVLALLPDHLVKNSIAGLLMPYTIAGDAQGYYHLVLKKK